MASGLVGFDLIPAQQPGRRVAEASHGWSAPRARCSTSWPRHRQHPLLAILTDAAWWSMRTGPIDRGDRRAQLITRIGVDLSERSVWHHRHRRGAGRAAAGVAAPGEHFPRHQHVTAVPARPVRARRSGGVGMLDLTGIDTAERPELKHLVAQSAPASRTPLALSSPTSPAAAAELAWPHRSAMTPTACLDWTPTARPPPTRPRGKWCRSSPAGARALQRALCAAPEHCLTPRAMAPVVEVPLWSGLRLNAPLQVAPGQALSLLRAVMPPTPRPRRSRTWRPSSSARRCRTQAVT